MASFAVRRTFVPRHNRQKRWDETYIACDRCGQMFKRRDLREQNGLLVDQDCFDNLDNQGGST